MSPKMPNSRRNLDLAIERVFDDRETALRMRRVMANVIVGQLLPDGVVKGGSAMKIRFGFAATRVSSDLDTARAKDIEAFINELESALIDGWNGFTGHIVPLPPAKPKNVPPEYVMQPFDIKLSYNEKPWITVPLEVGSDEIGDADEPEYFISDDIVEIFRKLGFPDPKPVPLMPLHHQIAQKLHGASEEGSARAHDLVDLQVIVNHGEIDWVKTRETCIRLFNYRRKQTWPPVVSKGEDWESLYDAQRGNLDVETSVDGAIAWANDLIKKIDSMAS